MARVRVRVRLRVRVRTLSAATAFLRFFSWTKMKSVCEVDM